MTYISLILCFFIDQEMALAGLSVPHWALALVFFFSFLKILCMNFAPGQGQQILVDKTLLVSKCKYLCEISSR